MRDVSAGPQVLCPVWKRNPVNAEALAGVFSQPHNSSLHPLSGRKNMVES